jgi:EAL and modified HD-GYP domain-containing signal transduction protein
VRGAALEALCKRDGCDRDEQDIAFMTGVFSLLDRCSTCRWPKSLLPT